MFWWTLCGWPFLTAYHHILYSIARIWERNSNYPSPLSLRDWWNIHFEENPHWLAIPVICAISIIYINYVYSINYKELVLIIGLFTFFRPKITDIGGWFIIWKIFITKIQKLCWRNYKHHRWFGHPDTRARLYTFVESQKQI